MIRNLIIQLTSDCNLNCGYCYSKNKFVIDRQKILESINKVVEKYNTIKNIAITGGEPLLEYDFLIKILCKLKNNKVKKTILTNGLLLNPSMIKELKNINVGLKISVDGFVTNEKKPSPNLIKLIKDNKEYLNSVAKVITKKNLRYLYNDFLELTKIGFKDIEIIPQMYICWNKEEIDFMCREIRKIVVYCLNNNISTNLTKLKNSNRYYKCGVIRILPDGDISFCNSLNSIKKKGFINNKKLNHFQEFKNRTINFALKNYSKKDWFKDEHLDKFCMIDYFYYAYLNNKSDKFIISSVNLFSKLGAIKEND